MDMKKLLQSMDGIESDNTVSAGPANTNSIKTILESFDSINGVVTDETVEESELETDDEAVEESKPDFLDLDKDGDKKEPMKKAAKDAKKEESVNEENREISAQNFRNSKAAEAAMMHHISASVHDEENKEKHDKIAKMYTKAADMFLDGDSGALELYKQAEKLAKHYGLEESADQIDEAIMVSAEGEEAESLLQILKLSGMPAPSLPVPATEPEMSMEPEMDMQDEYANSPDEVEMGIDAAIADGNDLNKPKQSFPDAEDGDNPMAAFESKLQQIMREMDESENQ